MTEQDPVLQGIEEVAATMSGEASSASPETPRPIAENIERVRRPTDIIPPEGFRRGIIDRNISKPNSYFAQAFGWEHSVLPTATDRLQALGSITLLDIGCGSGNTLRTWQDFLRQHANSPSDVTAIGLNLHDYSNESQHSKTREAIKRGDITYIIGDAENIPTIPEIPKGSVDIALACMSLIHLPRPALVVRHIVQALRPGGVAFVNVPEDLYTSGSPLMEQVYKWEDDGYSVSERVGEVQTPIPGQEWQTLFLRIQKPKSPQR